MSITLEGTWYCTPRIPAMKANCEIQEKGCDRKREKTKATQDRSQRGKADARLCKLSQALYKNEEDIVKFCYLYNSKFSGVLSIG